MTEDPRHAAFAELLGLLLQGRPEAVTTLLLGNESLEVKGAAAMIADTMAALAVALPAEKAADAGPLRARIMKSLATRQEPRTALLVIDMQNDNLTPGSAVEVPRARDIVPALSARLDAARAAGVPVIYVIDQHEPDDEDLDVWTTHNVKGSKGAEVWPELTPHEGDTRVTKTTYSAFMGSKLDAVLDALGVDTLVLTGCLTEVGIAATAIDALQRGYAVQVPPDAQAGTGAVAEGVAMATLSMLPPYGPARKARLKHARSVVVAR